MAQIEIGYPQGGKLYLLNLEFKNNTKQAFILTFETSCTDENLSRKIFVELIFANI